MPRGDIFDRAQQQNKSFDYIPNLYDLLPSTAGIPGVEYALVCAHNAVEAKNEGWGQVIMDLDFFKIVGPKGETTVFLACKGEPISGLSPFSGARALSVDEDIHKATGLWIGTHPDDAPADASVEAEAKPKSNGTGKGNPGGGFQRPQVPKKSSTSTEPQFKDPS